MAVFEKRNGNRYRAGEAACPFYGSADSARVVCCEGLTDRSQIIVRHNRKKDHDEHMARHCVEDYKSCAVYKMLIREKYGG